MMSSPPPSGAYGRTGPPTAPLAARQSPSVPQMVQHFAGAKDSRPASCTAEFPPRNVNNGSLTPRFALLSPTSAAANKTEASPATHAPSPQRLFNQTPTALAAFKNQTEKPQPPPPQQHVQQQQHQQQGQSQGLGSPLALQPPRGVGVGGQHQQSQQQQIHQLQYPYYNAKLESLTHRMPNLSFDGLGAQQQHQQQHQQQQRGVEGAFSAGGLLQVHQHHAASSLPASPSACVASASRPSASSAPSSASCGALPDLADVFHYRSASTSDTTPESISTDATDKSSKEKADVNDAQVGKDHPALAEKSGATELNAFLPDDPDPCNPSEDRVEEEQHEQTEGETETQPATLAVDLITSGQMTPESTDCGSLSKSSSDGDPVGVVSRKRPPTKLKSRRRNILSFPHHISVDELRLIHVRNV